MSISPKIKAGLAGLAVMAVYVVLRYRYDNQLSMRAWTYLGLLSFGMTALVQQWVHHRLVGTLSVTRPAVREMSLAAERLPHATWLAIFPPLIVAALLWWVTVHGGELPWRNPGRGSFERSISYQFFVGMLIFWNSLAAVIFVFALAVWHGMSRAYQFRRAQLQYALANQWLLLAGTISSVGGTAFRVSHAVQVAGVFLVLATGVVIAWNAGQLHRLHAANPRTGTWFYRDAGDPAFFGPHGVNLASGWCWALAGACIVPIILAEWMLRRGQG